MSRRSACSGIRPAWRRPEPRARDRAGEADAKDEPLDLEAHEVGGEPGRAEEEADDEVRPHGGVRGQSDAAEERRHAERPQDQPDSASEQADQPAGHDRREPRSARLGHRSQLEQEVEAVPGEHDGDAGQEQARRDRVCEVAAREGSGHRGRGHPRDDPPADAPGAGMREAARERRRGAHRDVRPRRRRRAPRGEQDGRQAQAPQHEPDERPERPGHERPRERERELDGVHSRPRAGPGPPRPRGSLCFTGTSPPSRAWAGGRLRSTRRTLCA